MKIVLDMNLSPTWVGVLQNEGWTAVHWQSIGDPKAPDVEIMAWAQENESVVFTHDLDFGTLLAITKATGPSVIQIRTQNIMPMELAPTLIGTIKQYMYLIEQGALLTIDEQKSRVRILPFS